MDAAQWIAFGGLLVVIASGGSGVIWKLGQNKTEIIDRIAKTRDGYTAALALMRQDFDREIDVLRREIEASERRGAEPIHAMREKVSTVELYIRDHYVSKREYERDHAQLLLALRSMQEAIEKRLDAYEERIEKVVGLQGRLPLG